jgi:hypothetical protein
VDELERLWENEWHNEEVGSNSISSGSATNQSYLPKAQPASMVNVNLFYGDMDTSSEIFDDHPVEDKIEH